MPFFQQFPNIDYDLKNNNRPVVTKNFFRHVAASNIIADDITTYTYYEVKEGDRPDTVSQELYGTPDYYWTFFVIDPAMKDGLESWPKDPATFEREMQLEFNDRGALVLVPSVNSTLLYFNKDGFSQSISKSNVGATTFAGIDADYPQLRVKRNGKYAKVEKWDNDLLQLKLGTFSDSPKGPHSATAKTTFFDGTHDITLAFNTGDNASPGLDSPRIDFIKGLAQALTRSFVDYSPAFLSNNSPVEVSNETYYLHEDAFNRFSSPSSDIGGSEKEAAKIIFDQANNGLKSIYTITPNKKYSDLRSAPAYYYANNDKENIISAYEAFSTVNTENSPDVGDQFANKSADTFVPNFEKEIEENDAKRFIKIVRPEVISQFAERYKQLINS